MIVSSCLFICLFAFLFFFYIFEKNIKKTVAGNMKKTVNILNDGKGIINKAIVQIRERLTLGFIV